MRLTTIRNRPKQTISASDGLGLLQMVSEPNTGDVASVRGWIVRSHIDWRREQSVTYKDVETSPYRRVLKS